ncbi:MAG: hypothetical protein HXS54_01310 [Theionarchaea archaeon]|nr:hypothetical protein [Theionarchaea archaeon]
MILDNVPISLLISGLFCVTIICVTALILAWRALSKGSQFGPDKVYLWIPITIGIFALSLDIGYSAERKAFFLTALLIGAYYFSDITHVVGEFVYKTLFNKELCRGPEESESMGKATDCPSCIAFSFADLPCTIMSNETVVILNPAGGFEI